MLADLSPVPALRKAAQQLSKMSSDRRAAKLVRECHRLLSVRAEANSPAIAQDIIAEFGTLTDAELDVLFNALASEFSPDPQAVLTAAQAYAADPSASDPFCGGRTSATRAVSSAQSCARRHRSARPLASSPAAAFEEKRSMAVGRSRPAAPTFVVVQPWFSGDAPR